ncbi:MAG: SDR family oxidoreductase [Nitrospinota bacterium]|nr:MAG: SDR family oxidoreductase [Nitrospinota bacterium]
MSTPSPPSPLLLTGATGYVGGRLLKALEASGRAVRCLVRRPEFLQAKVPPSTSLVTGDVLDRQSLVAAMAGVHTAYYLIHSMGAGGTFAEVDRQAAHHFGQAARKAAVKRIVYLGGLGAAEGSLSSHLRSRQEVGDILRQSGVPVTEFRAGIVIGSGSLSFEMIRALVERLPVMITPRWVSNPTQPIAIEDLIAYLLAALDLAGTENHLFEIGGPDRVSYGDMMREYARQRGLRRVMLAVPLLTPRLSSLWLGLVTPVYARIGRALIESIRHPTVVRDASALQVFPVRPMGMPEAIERALHNEDKAFAETRWSDSLAMAGTPRTWGGIRFGTRFIDTREVRVPCPPATAFAPIQRIGGDTGWYYADFLWQLRGFLDLLVGGVGLRRGRRNPSEVRVGDPIDFWRVEAFEPERHLRLVAEMHLPGRAWLEFTVEGDERSSRIRQTAIFDPVGLGGQVYWYALYPLHQLVFAGMLQGIAARALRLQEARLS